VFAAPTGAQKVAALNEVLEIEATGARLVDGTRRPRLAATGGRDPVSRLAVILADALAHALAAGGPERLGTCAADPCQCAYVDRTRGGRQRYCCELCNDRMAAAAYRRRRSG
jgi:predicted RNA-binding Zn ribbon-like protein